MQIRDTDTTQPGARSVDLGEILRRLEESYDLDADLERVLAELPAEHAALARAAADGRTPAALLARAARFCVEEVAGNAALLDILDGDDAWARRLQRDAAMALLEAAAPALKPRLLAALARHDDQEVRRAVAGNEGTPPEALAQLLEDEQLSVRVAAEDNAATPREALELMERAQFGPELPPEALPRLLAGGPYARLLAGRQRSLSAQALTALWRGGDRFVREGVAENLNVPEALLPELARDAEAAVRAAIAGDARLAPGLLLALHVDDDLEVRRASVTNPTLPAALLVAAAQHADRWMRTRAAGNPSSPPQQLLALARDSERLVRDTLLRNPALPEEALRVLCGDADAELAQKAQAKCKS